MTAAQGEYLGMNLSVLELDNENRAYFDYCAKHDFHLQKCTSCGLLRYPPGTACPWCQNREFEWTVVEGKGEVHSYGEVHQAIQPAFKEHAPYLVLLVELDTQKATPTEHEALRVIANLATPDGELAPHEVVKRVGIGTRVRMIFKDVGDGISLPLWTIDEDAEQPDKPWRYPDPNE